MLTYEEIAPGVATECLSCDECGCFFPDRDLLRLHLKEAHDSRKGKFECSRCPYTSVYKFDVKRHERIHTGEKPFQCRFCNRAFAQSSNLISHRRTHTAPLEKVRRLRVTRPKPRGDDEQLVSDVLALDNCARGVSFVNHEEIGPDAELSFCNEYHLVSPTGELPSLHPKDGHGSRKGKFECDYCSYSSNVKCNLVCHERIHTGEKPFQCRQCNRAFTQSSALLSHWRTHTGERPYPCGRCGRLFSRKSSMQRHRMTCDHSVQTA
ncbi:hypothetical protein HPB47_021527 [Ixodes persulcatus]|uniref:Uncharacterized protein n=1 Tax=Ixodes persulcatus TaxID=34615 RepID=A0AC60QDC9_IXOPE|nr:hypothetical protein HPB47_021527 [Ixodes persulcatus]